jgi:alpha-D-xyloside xylohydrolase
MMLAVSGTGLAQDNLEGNGMQQVAPGVWRIRLGTPEAITPIRFREGEPMAEALAELPGGEQPPFPLEALDFTARARGCTVAVPLTVSEHLYGLGMQFNSLQQRGFRKQLICNCAPVSTVGFTHAPVPFYVSTKGYGVYVDTARYATFYCGSHRRRRGAESAPGDTKSAALSTEELYGRREVSADAVVVDVPAAQGIDIYVFAGPTMKEALRRYNLFAGGGCLPPLWGLGVKYRGRSDFTAEQTVNLARYFREKNIPCDVFGLEPGWHTRAYSCSFVWNRKKFPDPDALIADLDGMGYRVNLWEHAYVHPESPMYEPLSSMAGDYPVWGGLVPDFVDEKARAVFGDYHDRELVQKGIAAFKCDECDNANYTEADRAWGFPEASAFPSGADGEQMHQLLGLLYQKTLSDVFRKHNRRTYFDVRASHALASPYSSTLYSDIYGHEQYVRMVATAGFSGVLWSPEVRQAGSVEDLCRRAQTSVMAAQTCFNSWFLKNPPWLQVNREKNNNDELLDNAGEVEAICRKLIEFRMRLIPYLYAAFARYRFEGIPPFRALVVDYPDDPKVRSIDDAFLIGDSMLAAPLLAGSSKRKVYFPEGNWYALTTGRQYVGKRAYTIDVGLDELPLFVKEGSIIPLAEPVQHVAADTVFALTCHVFGEPCRPFTLFEDDGETFNFEQGDCNRVTLRWDAAKGGTVERAGGYEGKRYDVVDWVAVKAPPVQERTVPPLPEVYLSDLGPADEVIGYKGLGPAKKDTSIQGNRLTVAGKVYEKGLGVHAPHEVAYELKPEYRRFVAIVGVDDEGEKPGSVVFQVFADEALLYESAIIETGDWDAVDVAIPEGARQLRLVVTDGGDGINFDHGDWANAGFRK